MRAYVRAFLAFSKSTSAVNERTGRRDAAIWLQLIWQQPGIDEKRQESAVSLARATFQTEAAE